MRRRGSLLPSWCSLLSLEGAWPASDTVASVCSGHGFKFTPVVGRLLADLATAPTPGALPPPSLFALTR